jgi:hypothetical protein
LRFGTGIASAAIEEDFQMAAVVRLHELPSLRSARVVHGKCLCGDVRYEITGPLGPMSHCHCSMCRKHHGTSFATHVSVPITAFRWVAGQPSVVLYRSSPFGLRSFCGKCGSVTPIIDLELALALCPAGNLEGQLDAQSQTHMFVGSKAPWHTITDRLPQHREF